MQETCKSFQVKASANREVDRWNTFLWVKTEHEKAIKAEKKTFTAGLNTDSTWSHVTVRQSVVDESRLLNTEVITEWETAAPTQLWGQHTDSLEDSQRQPGNEAGKV